MENPIKLVRWNKKVRLDSGKTSNIQCVSGPYEKVKEYAEKIAKENDAEVMVIV